MANFNVSISQLSTPETLSAASPTRNKHFQVPAEVEVTSEDTITVMTTGFGDIVWLCVLNESVQVFDQGQVIRIQGGQRVLTIKNDAPDGTYEYLLYLRNQDHLAEGQSPPRIKINNSIGGGLD